SRLGEQAGPTWWRCEFTLEAGHDAPLWLDLTGMTKGQVYLNGENVGRYFNATASGDGVEPGGPVWLPTPWLREGINELVLFDEHGGNPSKVRLSFDQGRGVIVAGEPLVAAMAGS
ncbi:MAG TPA: hypothetical protein ENK11_06935, partial [Phycisphaerales bacterium]|nr:hypothetical protein [Phycisphaerales bacterium]